MRVTEKKREANRQNAQKSTGPKTKKGKQIASQNALKHGLFARALILDSPHIHENKTEYNGLIYSLTKSLNPEGPAEEFLVRKAANCLWRSRRAVYAENAQIRRQLDGANKQISFYVSMRNYINKTDTEPTPEYLEQVRSICVDGDAIPTENVGNYIVRYEMRLDRQLSRTLQALTFLQKCRKENTREEEHGAPLKMTDRTQIPDSEIPDNKL